MNPNPHEERGRRFLFLLAGVASVALLAYLALGAPSWALPSQNGLRGTIVAELDGHVNWQGHGGHGPRWALPLRLVIYHGTDVYTDTVLTTDTSGDFLLPSVDVDTYDMTAKGTHTLRVRLHDVEVLTPTTDVDFGTLPEGDANGDNTVNAIDASIMATAYWTSKGGPGFDGRADFNEDGTINALDASLLATNYWRTGD